MMLPQGKQGFYLAITLVVVIVIILLAKDVQRALLIISLITNFFIISSQMILVSDRHNEAVTGSIVQRTEESVVPPYPWITGVSHFTDKEGFAEKPSGPLSFPAGNPHPGMTGPYPGGLDPHTLSSMGYQFGATGGPHIGPVYTPSSYPSGPPGMTPVNGPHPYPNNPYQLNRIKSGADPVCDGGLASESRNTHDADRKVVTHARWRNDPYRVAAGIMRKRDQMAKYVGEELAEAEHRPWWGRGDW